MINFITGFWHSPPQISNLIRLVALPERAEDALDNTGAARNHAHEANEHDQSQQVRNPLGLTEKMRLNLVKKRGRKLR